MPGLSDRRRRPAASRTGRGVTPGAIGRAIVVVLALPAFWLGSPGTASAMNREPGFPICGPTVYYRFVNTTDHAWTTAEKDAVSAALDAWETVINRSGAPIVDLRRGTGSPQIDIKIVQMDAWGEGRCDYGYIMLAKRLVGKQAEMNGVAVHEMGHVLGMAHVGWDDNRVAYEADFPTMHDALCVPDAEDKAAVRRGMASLAPDDHAHLYRWQGAGGSLSADPSFETAASVNTYFTVMNATFTRSSSGSPYGTYHLRFTGDEPWGGNHPYVFQETFIAGPRVLDAAAQVRRARSGDGGTVFVRLLRRPVDNPYACRFSAIGDWSIVVETLVTPTTSWALYDTPDYNAGTENAIFRVSVVNRLNYSCGTDVCRAEARVDDERVRAR